MTNIRLMVWLLALAMASGAAMNAAGQQNPVPSTAAVGQVDSTAPKAPTGFNDRLPRYQLEEGDAFALHFEFSPEFDQEVTVQPDGYITLRGVGDVHVAGETVPQLTTTLQAAYQKILYQPDISVVL